MKIPASLAVGGHVYAVTVGYVFQERSDLCGQADHSTKQIRVATLTPSGEPRAQSSIEETFFHELLHCVDEVYNAHALNEDAVSRMSEGLYAVLKSNGLLAE